MKKEEQFRDGATPSLIRFEGITQRPTERPDHPAHSEDFPGVQIIEQLRQRLLSQHGDSLETKLAIVGA